MPSKKPKTNNLIAGYSVSRSATSVLPGAAVQFTAQALNRLNSPLALANRALHVTLAAGSGATLSAATITTDDEGIATVDLTVGASVAPGTIYRVKVTDVDSFTGTSPNLTVIFDTTPTTVVIPGTLGIGSGTAQLSALVQNASSQVIPGLVPTGWLSSNEAAVTVSGTGLVRYVADGSATITAVFGLLTSNACAVTAAAPVGGGGGTDIGQLLAPNVRLPRVYLDTDVADTPRSGRTVSVTNAAQLTAALADLQPGDDIRIAAGAAIVGNFTVTRAGTADNWAYIRTAGSLPAEFVAWNGDADKSTYNPPSLTTSINSPCITFTTGAAYIRVMGVAFTQSADTQRLIACGAGTETSGADLPHHLVIDRCYPHGDGTHDIRRAIAVDCKSVAIIDCDVSKHIQSQGFDTQAIWSVNGLGPIKIVRNRLSSSTEVIGAGGGDPTIIGAIPADWEVRYNRFTKPQVSVPGTLVKNMIEFKKALYWLVEGNVLDTSPVGAQLGWGFVGWSVNQDGGDVTAECGHGTIRYNDFTKCASGFQISPKYDPGDHRTSVLAHDIAVYHNVGIGLDDPSVENGQGGNDGVVLAPIAGFVFTHNTMVMPANSRTSLNLVATSTIQSPKFKDNIIGGGAYVMNISDGAGNNPTFNAATAGTGEFAGNVVIGGHDALTKFGIALDPTNSAPADASSVGFVGGAAAATSPNATPSQLALASTSPYKGKATDGTDPGCDIATLLVKIASVPAAA